jgi:hypothetical protein
MSAARRLDLLIAPETDWQLFKWILNPSFGRWGSPSDFDMRRFGRLQTRDDLIDRSTSGLGEAQWYLQQAVIWSVAMTVFTAASKSSQLAILGFTVLLAATMTI